jgi:hypothetical protein
MKKGNFTLKLGIKIPSEGTNTSMYECYHCSKEGRKHELKDEHRGHTDRKSHWGAGIPVTYRVCTGCKREDGGWVSADVVGGGW